MGVTAAHVTFTRYVNSACLTVLRPVFDPDVTEMRSGGDHGDVLEQMRCLRGKLHGEDQADQAKDQLEAGLILPTTEPRKRAPTASRSRNA